MKITEMQNKDKSREYVIDGVQRETVEGFWQYLVDNKVVEGFQVKGEDNA